MCGIAGWLADAGRFDLEAALHAIRHRGPDANGCHRATLDGLDVGLGHARLSIIDLSPEANQPFASADGRHVIVYNGEVYNFQALRSALQAEGAVFRTRSDTEVVLQGLARHGTAFLARLDGMFALAWLDGVGRRLVLARDRLGIKPLYVTSAGRGFGLAFASEIRGLRALTGRAFDIDRGRMAEFLLNGFLYEPASGFDGVSKVPPGHFMELDARGRRIRTAAFVVPTLPRTADAPTPAARRDALDRLLRQSVTEQRVADVPLGLYFSGGVDSAAIAAASDAPLRGLYLDADPAVDGAAARGDGPYVTATAAALQLPLARVRLHPAPLAGEALLAHFRAVAEGVEEPISDYTYTASAAIAAAAREAGFTVMLSGMGGDEVFGGYPRYHLAARRAALRRVRPLLAAGVPALRRLPRFEKRWRRLAAFLSEPDFGMAYTHLVGYFQADAVADLLGARTGIDAFRERLAEMLAPVAQASPLDQAMHLDRRGFLAHNLTVTDKSSMQHGIEVRVPLLSNALLDFGAALPQAERITGRRAKVALSRWLAGRLPPALVYRPKHGFNPPLDGHVQAVGRGLMEATLTSGGAGGLLERGLVRRLVAEHFDGRQNHAYMLWQLLFLALWLDVSEPRGSAVLAA